MRYPLCFVAWLLVSLTTAPAQSPSAAIEGSAFLVSWKLPAYPTEMLKDKLEGEVVVEFMVTAEGRVIQPKVTSSSDARFEAAALECVQAWTFEPAVSGGRKRASAFVVPILFRIADTKLRKQPLNPPVMPRSVELTGAKVKYSAVPEYPVEFARRQLQGTVTLRFNVSTDGRPGQARVLSTASPELIRPALDALARSEFTPARRGDLTVEADLVAPFEFSPIAFDQPDVLAANGIRAATEEGWARFTAPPRPVAVIEPVYPFEALLVRRAGSAEVGFSISNSGVVRTIEVRAASAPEFGEALAAAVAHWRFRPASTSEGWTECTAVLSHTFLPPGETDTLHPDIARLSQALAPGGAGIGAATQLDRRITPVWQVQPQRPADFLAQSNPAEAVIEFIVDREGRARLPRVVRSTLPSVGWAAATAVSCWVFERPTQRGEPVDVRVTIPLTFPAP